MDGSDIWITRYADLFTQSLKLSGSGVSRSSTGVFAHFIQKVVHKLQGYPEYHHSDN